MYEGEWSDYSFVRREVGIMQKQRMWAVVDEKGVVLYVYDDPEVASFDAIYEGEKVVEVLVEVVSSAQAISR